MKLVMLQTAKDDIRRRFRHLLLEGHVEGIAERIPQPWTLMRKSTSN